MQIRFPDGSRIVRSLLKTDPVQELIGFVKYACKDIVGDKVFDLVCVRSSLLACDGTVQEAGCIASSLTLDYIS